jgi:CDP-glycerol glycerophosphotransferase
MLNVLKNYTRIFVVCALRIVLHIFWIFPIKQNRIFFVSYAGKQYSCNPKYIFECLYKKFKNKYDYIWYLDNRLDIPDPYSNIKILRKKHSISYIFYSLTANFYIHNGSISTYLPLRKRQIVINTWHGGGAYKRIGIVNAGKTYNLSWKFISRIVAKELTFFISSCERFTNIISSYLSIDKNKILPIGMPRNDILFTPQFELCRKTREELGINQECSILLYAPTFRGTVKTAQADLSMDILRIRTTLSNKFGKDFVCLYRLHYSITRDFHSAGGINVSSYQDMQELLCISDVLITDYSSSMWDFSLAYKPCFIYAPDLSQYKSERDFYTPIEEWPFPLAETNDELVLNILSFSENIYREKIKKHHHDLGSYERGNATEQICKLIAELQK